MPELRMFFTALLLSFAFCVPGKLVAQENGLCRPLGGQSAWGDKEATESKLLYIEDVFMALSKKAAEMTPEECRKKAWPEQVCDQESTGQTILPYFIYGEMLDPASPVFVIDLDQQPDWPNDYQKSSNFKSRVDLALGAALKNGYEAHHKIMRKASLEYQQQYGHISRPVIKSEELPIYEKRGRGGDLEAIFELRRYYTNPYLAGYNPEQTESHYWLFQAIKADSKAAMLEAGYQYPYAVSSSLQYQDTRITVDVYCEKIVGAGENARPGCFLYNLIIERDSSDSNYLILNKEYLNDQSITPKMLLVKKIDGQPLVELASFSNSNPGKIRRDYFDLLGQYLGSNSPDFTPSYFWNFKNAGLIAAIEPVIIDHQPESIAQTEIRTFPYPEAFWVRASFPAPKRQRLTALDEIPWAPAYVPWQEDESDENCNQRLCANQSRRYDNYLHYLRLKNFFDLGLPWPTLNDWASEEDDSDNGLTSKCRSRLSDISSRNITSCLRPEASEEFNEFMAANDEKYIETVWQEYRALPESIPYLTSRRQPAEQGVILQCCRATNKPSAAPCFALQVQYETEGLKKYHYQVNLPSSLDGFIMPVLHQKSYGAKGRDYLILDDSYYRNSRDIRIDIFDSEFEYIGSSPPYLASTAVDGYKPIPEIIRASHSEKDFLLTGVTGYHDWFKISRTPGCIDVLVEKIRK